MACCRAITSADYFGQLASKVPAFVQRYFAFALKLGEKGSGSSELACRLIRNNHNYRVWRKFLAPLWEQALNLGPDLSATNHNLFGLGEPASESHQHLRCHGRL